jgi:hypothetical protein
VPAAKPGGPKIDKSGVSLPPTLATAAGTILPLTENYQRTSLWLLGRDYADVMIPEAGLLGAP